MVNEREPPRLMSPAKSSQPVSQAFNTTSIDAPSTSRDVGLATGAQGIPSGTNFYAARGPSSLIDFTQQPINKPASHAVPPAHKARHVSNPFMVPQPGKPRPEHHRPAPPPQQPYPQQRAGIHSNSVAVTSSSGFNSIPNGRTAPVSNQASGAGLASINDIMSDYGSFQPRNGFRGPSILNQTTSGQGPAPRQNPDVVQIARSTNLASKTTYPASRPTFSSNLNGFQPANAWKAPAPSMNYVDLTAPPAPIQRDPEDLFDPNRATAGDGAFGSYDPHNYVDAAQASENIKALLEGAFEEDDEDKPKTRLRRRKKKQEEKADSAADVLTAKLKGLDIGKDKKDEQPVEEHDEEEDDGSVEGLSVKLLPHQIDGVAWMMDKEVGERRKNGVLPKGGILADDMGLGKTIQALSLILSNPRPTNEWIDENQKKTFPKAAGKGTLVVAPLALIKQWEAEIKDKVSHDHKLKVLVHHGPSRTKRFDDLKKYDVVISTYQTLTSEFAGTSADEGGIKVGCFGVHWYRIILDEAHSIKNRNAKMTQAAYHLRGVYRWCLTGTPMQNNLEELQSLIRFLQIKPYAELKIWKEQIGMPMKNGRGGLAMKRLQFFLKAFMKRRTKEILKKEGALTFGKGAAKNDGSTNGEPDTGPGFKIVGRKIENVVVEFSEHERGFYDRLAVRTEKSLEDMMGGAKTDYIGALVLLLRLRQVCNHPDLIKGNLSKEKDTLGGGGGAHGSQGAINRAVDDLDDVADMFGALSVETRKCDVCKATIGKDEAVAGAIRCVDCEGDLAEQDAALVKSEHRKKRDKKQKKREDNHKARDGQARQKASRARRVIDSDDDEADDGKGEWLVGKKEQHDTKLGKAGGQEDEDAEGGGEWLVSDHEQEDGEKSFTSTATTTTVKSETTTSDQDVDESATSSDDEDDTVSTERNPIASTKIRHLLSILARESPSHKIIVFSEFTSMLDIIAPLLPSTLGHVRYDGRMAHPAREASLHSLRIDASVRVLLCSLRCGSLGLNLTCASRVVLLEPFWNPFVEEQAIDRVHRLNQTKDVVVYKLTVRNSVEERILALQEKKRELATQAIEGGAGAKGGVNKLSMKDILSLFRRDADVGPDAHGANLDRRERVLPLTGTSTSVQAGQVTQPRPLPKAQHGAGHNQFGEAYGRRW